MKQEDVTKDELTLINKIIYRAAYTLSPHEENRKDLIQEAWAKFYQVLPKYNRDSDTALATYVYKYLLGAMIQYIRDRLFVIRIPSWRIHASNKIYAILTELEIRHGFPYVPDTKTLALMSGVKEHMVEAVMKCNYSYAPVDEVIFDDLPDVYHNSAEYRRHTEQQDFMRDCVTKLPTKEGEVIYNVYFNNLTRVQVGKQMGYSTNYICYLEKKGLKKLKEMYCQAEDGLLS